MSFIGQFSILICVKEFKIGKEILTKHIKNGLSFKDKLFNHTKLH